MYISLLVKGHIDDTDGGANHLEAEHLSDPVLRSGNRVPEGTPRGPGQRARFPPNTRALLCPPPSPGEKPLPGGEAGACGWLCLVVRGEES